MVKEEEKMTKNQLNKDIALFRYSIISPLLTHAENFSSNDVFFTLASMKEYVHPNGKRVFIASGTIERWFYNYKKYGFEGLVPKGRSDKGESRKINHEIICVIEETINKFPRLKATDIYNMVLSEGVKKEECSYATVNRIYKKIKLNIKNPASIKEMLRYEAGYANDIWCADSSHGPYLYIDNQKIKLYIIAFIDDASRMITGCKIYDSDNVVNLMATLKSAIATYGKPKVLNMDNGRNYRSKQMSIIAAKCGISLHYDPVKTPTSKAKIERFFKTLKEHWMASIDYHNFKSIDEYQTSLNDYIRKYNNTVHSSLNGKTPIERRDVDLNNIIYLTEDSLNTNFLFEVERRVSFDCVVILDQKEFQTPAKFANRKKVKIKYSFDFSKVLIVDENNQEFEIKELNKVENSKVKRKSKLTEDL